MSVICIAEDRPGEEAAIRLLLLTLTKHCPDANVILTFPPATDAFKDWVSKHTPDIELRTDPISDISSWDVKPDALLKLLAEGHNEVWWIDSDIVLTCDFRARNINLSPDTFVVCEDALYCREIDNGSRAHFWGFEVARTFPYRVNSCIMRVTPHHVSLLKGWQQLSRDERYQLARQKTWDQRPKALLGGQDLLTALLSTKEYATIPVKILKRGKDIIQYCGPAGYSPNERLSNYFSGLPPFIHWLASSNKPWRLKQAPQRTNFTELFNSLYLELSPYTYVASNYKNQIDLKLDWDWLEYSTPLGRLFRVVGLGNPSLTGLPLAIIYDLQRRVKKSV